jgi:hypothetical protein
MSLHIKISDKISFFKRQKYLEVLMSSRGVTQRISMYEKGAGSDPQKRVCIYRMQALQVVVLGDIS